MYKRYIVPIILTSCFLAACSAKTESLNNESIKIEDNRLNTQNNMLDYSYTPAIGSELVSNSGIEYLDSYHVEFENSKNSDLYVGTYNFNDVEYTAGYAKECDFKEYINLPDIISAEAETINSIYYNFAYYKNNVKVAYYYPSDDICIYIYTNREMTNDNFKSEIEKINFVLEGEK